MTTRREFLGSTTVMLLMIPVVACDNDQSTSTPSPGNPADGGCAITPTSTVTAAHTHMLCVLATDLTNPPSAGVTYTTTTTLSHTHNVSLTQAQLQAIAADQQITVTTTVTNSHTHQFILLLAPGEVLDAGAVANDASLGTDGDGY